MLKDYLNKDERIQLLYLKKYIDNIEKMLTSTNLAKEEHKELKMAMTYGLKAYESKLKRLNDTALETFTNSIKTASIVIHDEYAIQMYRRELSSKLDDDFEKNKDYYRLVELIMDRNCRNCTRHGTECEIYKEFEQHCIPEPEINMGNCKYAYKGENKNGTCNSTNEKIQ